MKTMTCKQLGGACHFKIQVENFNGMAALSRKHALEMIQKEIKLIKKLCIK